MAFAFSIGDRSGGDRTLEVTLSGELDLSCAEDLRGYVGMAVGDGCSLVFDLSGLTFIDSTGVGVLVAAKRLLRERFRVVGTQAPVERTLTIAGLSGHLL